MKYKYFVAYIGVRDGKKITGRAEAGVDDPIEGLDDISSIENSIIEKDEAMTACVITFYKSF